MKKEQTLLSLALATALAGGCSLLPKKSDGTGAGPYFCKGIAMSYVNGCQTRAHQCEFKAKRDWENDEWMKVKSENECLEIKAALENPAIRNYIESVRNKTVVAVKSGKQF